MKFVLTRREALDVGDGINAFLFALSDRLVELGHEVFLVTGSHSEPDLIRGLYGEVRYNGLLCLNSSPSPSHRKIVAAWMKTGIESVRRIKPHLTVVTGALPLRMPSASCTLSHDLEPRWSYGSIPRRLYKMMAYRRSELVVATCTELRDALAREIHFPAEKIPVIPTCVDLRGYRNERLSSRCRAMLHIGMPKYKNPLASLRIFAAMATPVDLYMTGNPTTEIKDFIAGLPQNKRRRVHLVGVVSAEELKRLLATVRLLCVPSQYAVPVASPTVLEGFASGTPVFGSTGISEDLLVDGITGIRAARLDIAAAAAIDRLMEDDETWTAISANALSRVAGFDSAVVAGRYLQLAESLVDREVAPA